MPPAARSDLTRVCGFSDSARTYNHIFESSPVTSSKKLWATFGRTARESPIILFHHLSVAIWRVRFSGNPRHSIGVPGADLSGQVDFQLAQRIDDVVLE